MNKDATKILFVLQFVGQPRFSKRISMMQDQGFCVEAIAFDRATHKGRLPPCPVTIMAQIEHGKYFRRIPRLIKALSIIRSKIKEFDVTYCMGADMSLLVALATIGIKRTKVVEVADVLPIQTKKGLVGGVARFLDRSQANSSDVLVVTAPDFLNVYYRKWLNCTTQGFVLENKIDRKDISTLGDSDGRYKKTGVEHGAPITIGYFGLLRCVWSWNVLISLAKNNPSSHKIVLAGRPMHIKDFAETIDSLNNVVYLGEFKSPDDLPSLYGQVDMVWACYKPIKVDDWNHLWARPNRFYESCLYSVPLITREGCNDSVVVKQRGLGFSLDSHEVEDAAVRVAAINRDQIVDWKKNMVDLPEDVYLYTTEGKELADAIRSCNVRPKHNHE